MQKNSFICLAHLSSLVKWWWKGWNYTYVKLRWVPLSLIECAALLLHHYVLQRMIIIIINVRFDHCSSSAINNYRWNRIGTWIFSLLLFYFQRRKYTLIPRFLYFCKRIKIFMQWLRCCWFAKNKKCQNWDTHQSFDIQYYNPLK